MIETLQPGDENSAHGLMTDLGYDISLDRFMANISLLRKQRAVIYLAKQEREAVGLIAARHSVGLVEGEYVEIIALVVASKHRGKGIGRALVNQVEAWAFGVVDTIRVRSNALREEAHRFYPSLGFQETKVQKVYIKKVGMNS